MGSYGERLGVYQGAMFAVAKNGHENRVYGEFVPMLLLPRDRYMVTVWCCLLLVVDLRLDSQLAMGNCYAVLLLYKGGTIG